MNDFMFTTTEQIIIWDSDDVIKAFYDFRNVTSMHDEKENTKQMIDLFNSVEQLFYAIRKDLGHENKQLSKGILLNLFIHFE